MVIIASAIAIEASSAEASIAIARQVWPGIRPLPNVPPPATPTPPPALPLPYPLLSPPPPSPARPPAPDHQAHEQLLPQPQQVQETAEVRRERRSRSWSGSSTSEEDNEEVGGASSEAGEDIDAVIARARERSAPELREERAARRRSHPSRMDWQAEIEGAQPSPSAVRLPPPHFSAHPDSASSGGRDEPLSVLYPLCDYVRVHFSPTGCTSRHTEGVAIEVLHHELAVWLGRTVHAGGANSEDARDVCLRMHGHVDSRAYHRLHGTTDLCPFADGSGSGFVATRSYTGRSDLLPSSLESAAEILFSSGVVILPDPGRLLSMEHERDIVAFSSVSNRPVAADSLVNGWRPIFNSSPSAVVENRQRQAWRDPAWAREFEARVAATLQRARLLEHAYDGPHAGHAKSVCDSSALRSLPGCTQQPWHADYAREY